MGGCDAMGWCKAGQGVPITAKGRTAHINPQLCTECPPTFFRVPPYGELLSCVRIEAACFCCISQCCVIENKPAVCGAMNSRSRAPAQARTGPESTSYTGRDRLGRRVLFCLAEGATCLE